MRLIFLGPPGSGKGTYASRMAPQLGIAHIATGDIFREVLATGTMFGKKVPEDLVEKVKIIVTGNLVPDEIVNEIIEERLRQPDCVKGFIFDGYPRTLPQAESLQKTAKIDAVINLQVPDNVIIERLSGRRTCQKCKAIYHIKYLLPKKPGICDKCGSELYQRKDDTPEVIKERLKVYEKQTEPLIKHYTKMGLLANVVCKRADIPPEEMIEKIYKTLRKLGLY